MTSWHILAVCILSLFVGMASAQLEYINSFKAAADLADDINKGEFVTVIKDVVQIASPFLKNYPSVLNLLFGHGSASTNSAELEYLRKLSDNINLKFDQVNLQFSEVSKLIRWTSVQASYAQLEANIHAVSDHFKRIFEVPISARSQQKQLFISSYNSYAESGSKLFAGFMNDNGVIGQGILRPAMNFTENNRGQMRTFMLGILKLLLMAAKVELGYQIIQGLDQTVLFYSHDWQIRFEQVQVKMNAVDYELKQKYHDQAKKDIDKFSMNNLGLSNQMFSRFLYRELSTKYFWRDWLVVVSKHTEGQDDAYSHVCKGFINTEYRKKDLVIDSVEKNTTSFDFRRVKQTCASLQQTCQNTLRISYYQCNDDPTGSHPRYRRCVGYTTENASPFFNRITDKESLCSPYSSYGVINSGKHPVYYAGPTDLSSDRLFVCDLDACNYFVHFFG